MAFSTRKPLRGRSRALAFAMAWGVGSSCLAACPPVLAERAHVVEVQASGDLVLEDGRTVRLAGLELPDIAHRSDRVQQGFLRLKGAGVLLSIPASQPDRWGRVVADVALAVQDAAPVWWNASLVEQGLVKIRPEEGDAFCMATLFALETAARLARRGVWADGKGLLQASDTKALLEEEGRGVVVEGRVLSIGMRRLVTYLNFGQDWKQDLTVKMSKRLWQRLNTPNPLSDRLKTCDVRIRGVVENSGGPLIEIVQTRQIELLDCAKPEKSTSQP